MVQTFNKNVMKPMKQPFEILKILMHLWFVIKYQKMPLRTPVNKSKQLRVTRGLLLYHPGKNRVMR